MELSDELKERIKTNLRSMAARAASPSSSSDESVDDMYVPYGERPEWSDVKPVRQDDGPDPVCVIDYTAEFSDTFDYFRAVLAKDERSERALELTKACATLNSANYTVWYFRRIVLKSLNKDLNEELDYVDHVILKNAKNYQVWHHRKVIVESLNDGSREKQFTNKILDQDAKNYHAWQHRQWFVAHFKLFDELDYVNSLLAVDIRNNSAWNHRYFVISRTTGFSKPEVLEREVAFTLSKITITPSNESPWNYLRGILDGIGLTRVDSVVEFCEDLYTKSCTSPHLLAFMVDIIEERLISQGDTTDVAQLKRALTLVDSLANEHDKIRKEYWNYIHRNLSANFCHTK